MFKLKEEASPIPLNDVSTMICRRRKVKHPFLIEVLQRDFLQISLKPVLAIKVATKEIMPMVLTSDEMAQLDHDIALTLTSEDAYTLSEEKRKGIGRGCCS